MARINRFYILIAMFISYRICDAGANLPLSFAIDPETGDNRCAKQFGVGSEMGCHVCIPITGYRDSAWDDAADSWIQRNNTVCSEHDCNDRSNTMYSVGTKSANDGNGYYLCTPNGWKRISTPNASVHSDTCSDIESVCGGVRETSSRQHNIQEYYNSLSSNYGTDMTIPKWQVCMFGSDSDFCYSGTTPGGGDSGTHCPANYYASGEDCEPCPSSGYRYGHEEDHKLVLDGTMIGQSLADSQNIASCFIPGIPGSGTYIDDSGVFIFTNPCYYN